MYAKMKTQVRAKALAYLKAKYPEADEHAFYTDYTGRIYDEVIQVWTVAHAAEIEEICGKCEGKECEMPETMGAENSHPIVRVSKSPRGFSFLDVRWMSGFSCKYEILSMNFDRMYKTSGLNGSMHEMTFKTYQSIDDASETRAIKLEAMKASEEGTNLIISGKAGTGKTHLAVAIAIYVMKHGRQAIFRLVSTMLDEIQSAIRDNGDYDGLMRQFKTVPCLVLDDLGQQTIVTTNAKDIAELCNWDKEEYMMPMVSRILERGKWVRMKTTEDYLQKRSVDNDR